MPPPPAAALSVTYAVRVLVLLPPAFVAVSRIDHVPALSNSVGFCVVAPLEKFDQLLPPLLLFSHSHDVGVFVLASVNATDSGDDPLSGVPVNDATGAVTGGV